MAYSMGSSSSRVLLGTTAGVWQSQGRHLQRWHLAQPSTGQSERRWPWLITGFLDPTLVEQLPLSSYRSGECQAHAWAQHLDHGYDWHILGWHRWRYCLTLQMEQYISIHQYINLAVLDEFGRLESSTEEPKTTLRVHPVYRCTFVGHDVAFFVLQSSPDRVTSASHSLEVGIWLNMICTKMVHGNHHQDFVEPLQGYEATCARSSVQGLGYRRFRPSWRLVSGLHLLHPRIDRVER